ncbi:two-component sensor histidine kinase [Vibrio ishigakensis]|uniref:histidine kinase n=1 Tax=Vibrio ishigakensis TaxID=1481914 RepID=A0A0B8NZC5_9VIBR|nr:two-component sensor histidine kinase [Vibrio ishigakensis]
MKPGDRFPKFTYPIVTASGEEKWVQVFLEGKFDIGNQMTELFGVVMDISDNYKRTIAIQKLNTELTRSNAELERFAYVASHDLKAPLRAIKNLSSWIEEDIEEIASDDTKSHLSLLGSRIERMEGMLEGLLQYARVSTRSFETTTLNLEKELDDIWSLLGLINISISLSTLMWTRYLCLTPPSCWF